MVKRFFHWLAHLTGRNEGRVITYEEDGYICVAFECSGCKQIDPSTVDKIEKEVILNE